METMAARIVRLTLCPLSSIGLVHSVVCSTEVLRDGDERFSAVARLNDLRDLGVSEVTWESTVAPLHVFKDFANSLEGDVVLLRQVSMISASLEASDDAVAGARAEVATRQSLLIGVRPHLAVRG